MTTDFNTAKIGSYKYWSPPEGRGATPPDWQPPKNDSMLTINEYYARHGTYPPNLSEQLETLRSLVAENNGNFEEIERIAQADTTDNSPALHTYRVKLGVNTAQLLELVRYQRQLDSQPPYIGQGYFSVGRGVDPNR